MPLMFDELYLTWAQEVCLPHVQYALPTQAEQDLSDHSRPLLKQKKPSLRKIPLEHPLSPNESPYLRSLLK